MNMFSHVCVGSNDLGCAGVFYDAVLKPLGLHRRPVQPDGGPPALCWTHPSGSARFFVYSPFNRQRATPSNGGMVAFAAPSASAVADAYEAGLAHGGSDAGPPGLRRYYAPDYFGAYLRDPDGNKIHFVHRASWDREMDDLEGAGAAAQSQGAHP